MNTWNRMESISPSRKGRGGLGFLAAVLALLTVKGLLTGLVWFATVGHFHTPPPLVIVVLVLVLMNFFAYLLLFSRAGRGGFELLIPYYGAYGLFQITWGSGWLFLIPAVMPWFLYFLLDVRPLWVLALYVFAWGTSGITFFGPGLYPFLVHMYDGYDPPLLLAILLFFVLMTLYAATMHKLSASFECDLRMTLGLLFFGPVFALRLAFGKTEYIGPM